MPKRAADPGTPAAAEAGRLAALLRYAILDTPPEPDFDAIAALAASLCDAPIGLINFVDDARQFFKARAGFDGDATAPLDAGFCPLVVHGGKALVICDTLDDPVHAANPAAQERGVRFYAGVPLVTPDNQVLGTLCVLDIKPRPEGLAQQQKIALATLSRQVISLLELRRTAAERDAQAAELAAVFAQAQVGISEIAPDGRFLAVNDRLCEMVGRSRDALLELGIQDVTHPDDLPGNLPLFARMMETGEVFSVDKRYVRPDGGIVWANSSVSRLLDAHGRARAAVAVTVDMTAHRADEARKDFLLSLSDRLRALADPRAIMAEAASALGRHLCADSAGYSEIDLSGEHITIEHDWSRPGFPSVAGTHRLDDFGAAVTAELRAARTVAVAETRASPLTGGGATAAAYARVRVRAFIDVPLVKDRRLAAILFVVSERPRQWSAGEVAVVEEVAERTRHAVERVRADLAQRERDEQFRTLADNISQLAWMTEPDGWIVWYNRRWFEYTGTTLAQMQGWGWQAVHHPEHVARVTERFRAAVAAGEPWEDVFPLRGRDGQYRWFLSRALPIRDDAGAIVRWFGTNTDVTDAKEREEALRRSEAQFRTTADALPGMLFVATADGANTYVNEGFCHYTGRRPDDLLGDRWAETLHPDDARRAWVIWGESVRTGAPYRAEYRFRRHDGAWRWHLVRGLPVPDGSGGIDRWVGTCTDIHDRRVFEAELRALNAELADRIAQATAERAAALAQLHEVQKLESIGHLTGGIAHDFNNMLQGVAGSLELMRRRIAQGRAEEVALFVDGAAQAVARAAALTHRLLAFARRQALQPKPVEPDDLVADMAELIRRTVGPQVEVELRMNGGVWTVLCDPNQLESALLNLAINARDAMPEGGRLVIGTRDLRLPASDAAGDDGAAPGEYVEISVADTGVGMPPDVRARAFEPFFTTKPIGQGTGLGLSQLYGFVRQSGGVARLESEPGRGTTVRLYLPRHVAAALEPDADRSGPGAGAIPAASGGIVLVVEDEPAVRALVVEVLRELGCRVLEAADGPDGLRLLLHARERVDVLVTDVGLPGLNGRQLADAARERDPRLPVLLITGYAGTALDGAQLAPGMEVIAKPFALHELAARVAAMLRERTAAPAL